MLFQKIQEQVDLLDASEISVERKAVLQEVINYINQKVAEKKEAKLNFICTHNSRRSQLTQVWAKVAADYFKLPVQTFSGGVEVTAFNERAVSALQKAGFVVEKDGEINPRYCLKFGDSYEPIIAFSKIYDDEANPKLGFAAIMTCSHADENCPFISGAEKRIPVRYEDPKAFDDSPQENEMYALRSKQIANEMFYVMSQVIFSS